MYIDRLRLLAGASALVLASRAPDDGAGGGAAPAPAPEVPAAAPPAPAETGGEGAAPPPAPEGAAPEPPAPEAPKPRVPWQNKRIDTLTARTREQDERIARLEREAEAARARADSYEALYGRNDDAPAPGGAPGAGGAPAPAPAAPGATRVFTEAEVQAEAARIANVQRLNERCEAMFDSGATKHKAAWNERIGAARDAFGADLMKRPDLFDALTKLKNGDDVYFALAGDLDHLSDVLAMPPVQLGMELARLSAEAAGAGKGPAISRAPAPITPVDAGGGSGAPEDTMESYASGWEERQQRRYQERGY